MPRRSGSTSSHAQPNQASVFDDELEQEITDILKIGRTHMAGISVSRGINDTWMEHHCRTIVTGSASGRQDSQNTPDGGTIFHVASLTKALIAAAVVIAIEIKATDDRLDNRYAGFKDIQDEPLTRIWNQHNTDKMRALPGNPTFYNLMVHFKGLPSYNHRLLAFDGTPIMTMAELRNEILQSISQDAARGNASQPGSGYSNLNYSAIAMTIATLWGGSFESFMEETLFAPLGMTSTSIGAPTGHPNFAWIVDSMGRSHKIQRPFYGPNGAESGALGAYSTVQDLGIFYKFLIDSFNGHTTMAGFDIDVAAKLFQITYEATESLEFSPLGIYTDFVSSNIGAMSLNRLQFPEEDFSTYSVLRNPLDSRFSTFYSAGTAIGCTCATAIRPRNGPFAVVVLTDTSGPVDTADHILRLILRKLAWLSDQPDRIPVYLSMPGFVSRMARSAMYATMQKWKQIESEDSQYISRAPGVDADLAGIYKGDGFSQHLEIVKEDDGDTSIMARGSSELPCSKPFRVVWSSNTSVKICVPPHLSIDCLSDGDWSNLTFRVQIHNRIVVTLTRTTTLGEDRFVRVTMASGTSASS